MTAASALSASQENYLETIFLLIQEKTVARSKDISKRLNVNRSSVTGALQSLRQRGLVNYEPYGYVTLTPEGTQIARRVVRRHEALRDFFVNVLAIDRKHADEAACRMEHGISKEIVDRLIDFADFVEVCPRAGARWVRGFGYQCQEAQASPRQCERCMTQCLEDFRQQAARKKEEDVVLPLAELETGQKAQIVRVTGTSAIKRRIRDMGVTRGSLVEIVRVAPLGSPIDIKVKGYHLTLRQDEAEGVHVRPVG